MNRFRDTFLTVTDRDLFGPDLPHGMNTLTRWLTNSGCVAPTLSSLTHASTWRQTIMSSMSRRLQSDLCAAGATDPLQHRSPLPKLDILAVDGDEEPPAEWEAEDDVKGGPLDPREVKNAREKEIKYLWDMEVRIFHRSAGTGANRTQSSWPQVDRYQQRKRRSSLPFTSGVYGGAP